MSNTITAFFKGRVGVAEAVYQNDYGIVMNLDSIELPAHFDCYFSTLEQDEAIPGIGADNQVAIPNDCLTRAGNVTLHIPLHTGANDSEVEYIVYFKVIGRARPVDDGTPVQMSAIERALALLQNPIGNIEQIVNEALAFTGDTFDQMKAELDADQAAYKQSVDAQVTNLVTNVKANAVETLWTGTLQTKNQSVTLSEDISNYDFIDIYTSGHESVYLRKPVSSNTVSFEVQTQNMSDTGEVSFMRWWETNLTISGKTATITKTIRCYWDDFATAPVIAESDGVVVISRIDGVKIGSHESAELTDVRVGADGKTYTTAGESVRTQFANLKSDLRAKEVNTWNMWDGSWGVSNKSPLGTSYPYIVYSPSIPVTAGEYYSIGIVANALPSKVNVVNVRFYSESASVGSAHSIWKNGGYLDWVQAPTGATRASVFFNTNDASVPLTPAEFLQARFKVVFAHRLVNNSPRDNTGRYIFTADEWIPSYLWDTKSINNARTNIVTVGASGSNFTSLRDAIDTINSYGGASETNRFEVRIKEGTYDISSYYTSEEKAQSGFVGLTVPDWVTLKGVGNREKTILKYVLSTASTNICVLNLMNTCSLENLTLYGVKTRYCVHDDKANYIGTPYKRYCKNVHFKGDTMTLGAVYGAGINSNAEWIFEDCIFESLTETNYQNCFSVHGSGQQVQVGSSSVLFDNCRFVGHGSSLNNALILSTLMNNASYFQNYCKLQGCSANGRLILREENASSYGAGIAWWATGYATTFTSVVISNTDGLDYSENVNII